MKKIAAILIISLTFTLSGCINRQMQSAVIPFTEAEEKVFVDEFSKHVVVDKAMPEQLIQELGTNIQRLSQVERDNAVDGILYNSYILYNGFSANVSIFQDKLLTYHNQGVNLNDNTSVKKHIKEDDIRSFLTKLHNNLYILSLKENQIQLDFNFKTILDKYSAFISPYFIDYINFYKSEQDYPLKNSDESYNLNEIVRRILATEEYLNRHKETVYASSINDSSVHYMQLYLGLTNDINTSSLLFDENKKARQDIIQHYHETITKYPHSTVAQKLSAFIEKLEQTKYIQNDDINVFILDLTGAKFTTEQTTLNDDLSNSVPDIEDNKPNQNEQYKKNIQDLVDELKKKAEEKNN